MALSCAVLLLIGFSITNAVVFLHVGHWFRRLVSGLRDREFRNLIKQGSLSGFRRAVLGRLVRCHACSGFWIGTFLYMVISTPIVESMMSNIFIGAVMYGMMQSGFNFVLWVILRRLGAEEM